MPITQDYILKGGLRASDEAAQAAIDGVRRQREQGAQRVHETNTQRAQQDAALRQLIRGKELDLSNDQAKAASDMANAEALRAKYGNSVAVHAGSASLGDTDPLARLLKRRELEKPQLTPAQVEAEKVTGKKVGDWEAAGGRPTAEQNVKQIGEVRKDLADGKRDTWDRVVGGATSGFPSLMGMVAGKEKARRDKVRNTAVMLARQSDPNPTQKQIEDIMGQIYDPSSSDMDNDQRLADYERKIQSTSRDMDQAATNLRTTGYTMPGLSGAAPAMSPSQGPQTKQINGRTYIKVPGGWKAQ